MVSWGVAGWGWIARDFAGPAIERSANGRLVARHDPGLGTDLDAFLATPGLDAVYVAAPNDAHATLVVAAAEAGKHVLCEKPMATTLADAEAMVEACARAGVRYGTAFNQRFHPAHVRLRELIAAGALGTVTQARVKYACVTPPWWGPGDWHFDPARAGGGALFDLAPHGLDLLGVLLDRELTRATALHQHAVLGHDVEDGAVVAAEYEDVLAVLQVSYAHPETMPRRVLEVVGTGGMAVATDTMGQEPGGSLVLHDAADGSVRSVPFDAEGDPFVREVEAFAAGDWPYAPERDLRVMAVLASLAAEVPA
jgi:1,5-anhydro-D-fructose reductase (1,5-anhydro-D-mannitol-forming)